jgi:uncharacterized oligopeptide transporter (OPT) family protein
VTPPSGAFRPYVPAHEAPAELTVKAVVLGLAFGILFGAATVYLALKAGLTVSASIPIAVLAISVLKRLGGSTILENNLVQTIGSAGESIAAGVVFTLPGFLFLATDPATGRSVGEGYFSYGTIATLSLLGGVLGTLMMVPLRRSLIVREHGVLPYPEGTACASVLVAGERGGDLARRAFSGVGVAFAYAMGQKILRVIAEAPTWATSASHRFLPAATVSGEITPEYLGVGYIIGPRISAVLVAGGILAWLGLIPLLATVTPPLAIAGQLHELGYLADLASAGGRGGWDPATQTFADPATAVYYAYVRQIGAGAVATGGFLTLLKTLPTIARSFRESLQALRERQGGAVEVARTDRDLSLRVVLLGSLGIVAVLAFLPFVPGTGIGSKLVLGACVVAFGFFFVTVASRIVGIIGSSSNPISGMTIATLMATCLFFAAIGWTGDVYQPMALCVGALVCIAAANAGATSQDLKTGYIVGATPRAQQLGLLAGAVAAACVIGLTVQVLDRPTPAQAAAGIAHAIGTERYPAPQGTLMATLIRGLLSSSLDWQFVLVGACLAVTVELCGVNALSFAVGAYLPLSTTAPIFAGGVVRWWVTRRRTAAPGAAPEDEDLGPGNLFATGLVAGGALAGVLVAILSVSDTVAAALARISLEPALHALVGGAGYELLGVATFAALAILLARVGLSQTPHP